MASKLWFNSVEDVVSELVFYGIIDSAQDADEICFKKTVLPSNNVSLYLFKWLVEIWLEWHILRVPEILINENWKYVMC